MKLVTPVLYIKRLHLKSIMNRLKRIRELLHFCEDTGLQSSKCVRNALGNPNSHFFFIALDYL